VLQIQTKVLFSLEMHNPREPQGLFSHGSKALLSSKTHPFMPIPLPVYPCRHEQ